MKIFLICYEIILSAVVFIVCGIDKHLAVSKRRRVPERTILGLSAIGGAPGLLLGMCIFRHKTLHFYFWLTSLLFSAVWIYFLCVAR